MSTNFSDFYFVERAVTEAWVWTWFLHRVWSTDKFTNLTWVKVKTMESKSLVTILILITLPILTIYDISWIKIKYSENYIISANEYNNNNNNNNQTFYLNSNNLSQILLSKEDQVLRELADYLLCIGYSLQTGILFLLQAFWKNLADKIDGKTSVNSWTFKLHIFWGLLLIVMFTLPRFILRNNKLLSEIIPNITLSIVLLVILYMGIRTRIRLKKLVKSFHRQSFESLEASLHVNYFLETNCLLIIGLLLTSVGFLFSSTEELVMTANITSENSDTQTIIANNVFRDFSSVLTNLGNLILWVTIIFIIYPRYHMTGLYGSLSLTKKTLNRLSKVVVVANNNVEEDRPSRTKGNDGGEYHEEESNSSYESVDENDESQGFSVTVVDVTTTVTTTTSTSTSNNINNNFINTNDENADFKDANKSIDHIIKEQDKIIKKFKESSNLTIAPPPPSLQPTETMSTIVTPSTTATTTTTTITTPPLTPSSTPLQSATTTPLSSPKRPPPSLNMPPPPSSPPPHSALINNNYDPLPSPPMSSPYKDDSIPLSERNVTSPPLITSQQRNYHHHHQNYNHHHYNNSNHNGSNHDGNYYYHPYYFSNDQNVKYNNNSWI